MKGKRVWAMLLLCLLLTGCTREIPFDPATEGVVDVIVLYDDEPVYYALSADGRRMRIDAFGGDEITVYTPDDETIKRAKGINRLTDVRLCDAAGNTVPPTRLTNAILQATAELEHSLFVVQLIRAGDEWFVYVELNVNWVSPCDLYWYDQARGGLVEVHSFDGISLEGLRVRDVSRLATRPLYRPDPPGRGAYPQAAEAALLADFAANRALCDAAAAVLHGHPELFDMLRQDARPTITAPDGTRHALWRGKEDERFCGADMALFNEPERDENGHMTERGWAQWDAQWEVPAVPFAYFADKDVLTDAETQQVQSLLDAMQPMYIGQEGAMYLHFALTGGNEQTWPFRLYYTPEAAVAEACAAAWNRWEALGGNWYLAAMEAAE